MLLLIRNRPVRAGGSTRLTNDRDRWQISGPNGSVSSPGPWRSRRKHLIGSSGSSLAVELLGGFAPLSSALGRRVSRCRLCRLHRGASPAWFAASGRLRTTRAALEYVAPRCGPRTTALWSEINRVLGLLAESGELRRTYDAAGVPFHPPFSGVAFGEMVARYLPRSRTGVS